MKELRKRIVYGNIRSEVSFVFRRQDANGRRKVYAATEMSKFTLFPSRFRSSLAWFNLSHDGKVEREFRSVAPIEAESEHAVIARREEQEARRD